MAWFRTDDRLHAHRKARALRRSAPDKARDVAPLGLWVMAGSWARANSPAGFIPLEVLQEWDDDAEQLAERLVSAGLWHPHAEEEEGYLFHDWSRWQGFTDEEPPRDASTSGRVGNHTRWHVNKGVVDPECEFCIAPESGAMSDEDRGDIAPNRSIPNQSNTKPIRTGGEPDGFEAFWTRYPKKEGKGAAVKAWRAASKKAETSEILAGLNARIAAWSASNTERKFIPLPATWLNQERWTDVIEPARRNTNIPEGWGVSTPRITDGRPEGW